MKLLCKIGVHYANIKGTEEGKGDRSREIRQYSCCDCGKKKVYDHQGQWVTDNDLLGFGSK